MSKWKTINPFEGAHQFDARPGVYALYCQFSGHHPQLIYVGESVRVRTRVLEHGLKRSLTGGCYGRWWGNLPGLFAKVRYSDRFGQEAMIERRLIRRLQPQLNRKGSHNRAPKVLGYGRPIQICQTA